VHLLRYVVKCTVTDSLFNARPNCSKCPPSAWINFLCDQRTCKLPKHCSVVDASCSAENSLPCSPCVGLIGEQIFTNHVGG